MLYNFRRIFNGKNNVGEIEEILQGQLQSDWDP